MSRRTASGARVFDLRGPEGNVFHIAGLAQSWNRQLDNDRPDIMTATTARLKEADEWFEGTGDYNDVLDTFDLWFKDVISYAFVNDPRDPSTHEDDYED